MDFITISERLLPLFILALSVGIAALAVTCFLYLIYRKRGGQRKISLLSLAAAFLVLGWFMIVMFLTTFSRGANFFEDGINLSLFSGYINAWHNWSLNEFQLIIFNMLMFAPLGFLLPLISRKMRSFERILFASLLVTIGIEIFQLLTGRGIFELDDILHNTIGSMAGYLLMQAIIDSIERRKITVLSLFKACCIPLAFTLLFSSAFLVYHNQELGNLAIRPAMSQNMKQVEVTLNTTLPDQSEPVALYYNDAIYNKERAKGIAALVKDSFGLQQSGVMRIEGPNRIWMFHDTEQNEFTLNYSLSDGAWSFYSNADAATPTESDRDIYEQWMISHQLLGEEAVFSIQNGDTLRWEHILDPLDIAKSMDDYTAGIIMIIPSIEKGIPQDIFFTMSNHQFIRKVDIISPAEAYKQILKGKFGIYQDLKKGDHLSINKYKLSYVYDSKGYYQPAYQFEGEVNGQTWSIMIPAI